MIVMVNNGAVVWSAPDGATVPGYVPGTQLSLSAANWSLLLAAPKLANGLMPDPRTVSGITATAVGVQLTQSEFIELMTTAEYAGICAAAITNPQVFTWLITALSKTYIDLSDPLTAAGLDFLVSVNLLTAARVTAILANQPPTAS